MHHLSEQELERREKLQRMLDMGINPYPAEEVAISHQAKDILNNYSDSATGFDQVTLAGRIMSMRVMGKASFAQIKDASGLMQIYVAQDEICPTDDKSWYTELFRKLLDLGDFIWVSGAVFRTKTGEVSVKVRELKVLCKSLRPLPVVKTDAEGNVHDAFSDPELRYRQRYVDLIVNEKVKETFLIRNKVISGMREFFNEAGYLEMDTPVLQPIPGGASARPFITHHNALDIPLYMRIANELYLKRLIVGGFEGVYEFSRNFRNEGIDRTHNPEFTVMEIYVAYKDYFWMMDFTEKMLYHIAMKVHGSPKVKFGDYELDFTPPFRRLSMIDAIKEFTSIDITGMQEEELRDVCRQLNIPVTNEMGAGKLIDEIFGEKCEKNFIQPTFITDYPLSTSPLCKQHRSDPNLVERFELMVNGKELANAYSELNDPIDQRNRFKHQMELSQKGDDEAMVIDYDFLRALEYGMPPTSGMGIGVDRLCMLMSDNASIQEVILFPQMRLEKWD